MRNTYSVVIPAYNEEKAISLVLSELIAKYAQEKVEIIVVNDCSDDQTAAEAAKLPVKLINNVQNFGYGYSLKQGIRAATHAHIIILDADGSYPVSSLPTLIDEYEKGFDMVVGARQGVYYQGSTLKRIARFFFRVLSEFATGRKIPDINSGCRIFRKDVVMRFFHTLSSGFSFTTTITLAFMLNAHSVRYIPIEYHKRKGSSKVRYLRDTLRSAQIIVEAIVFYNPLKMFLLCTTAIILIGILALAISFLSFVWAILFFFTFAFALLFMSLGLVTVFLKFTHNDAHHAHRVQD